MDPQITNEAAELLADLKIPVYPGNSESCMNGSLEIILHIIECTQALKQVCRHEINLISMFPLIIFRKGQQFDSR